MLEKIAHVGTALAAIAAIFMLSSSIKQQNRLEAEKNKVNNENVIDDWQRSAIFEAVLLKRFSKYDQIESHYLKRASQITDFVLPSEEKTNARITRLLSKLVEDGTVIVDEESNYLSSSDSNTRIIGESMSQLFDGAFKEELELSSVAFEIAETLSKEGGSLRISALSRILAEKHPEYDKVFLRKSFIHAQQIGLILLDQEPDTEPNQNAFVGVAPGQPNFQMRLKASGVVRLNPAIGYDLF